MKSSYIKSIWNCTAEMAIGKTKTFTNSRLNPYLLGHFEKQEIFNLSKSRQLLIWQIVSLFNTMYKEKYVLNSYHYIFASEAAYLQGTLRRSARNATMQVGSWPWINGTISNKVGLRNYLSCAVIPDGTDSPAILKEATSKPCLIMGLINSNQSFLHKISHPIFGNSKSPELCIFVTQVISNLIKKYERKSLLHLNGESYINYLHLKYFMIKKVRRIQRGGLRVSKKRLVGVRKEWIKKKKEDKNLGYKSLNLNSLKIKKKSIRWLKTKVNYKYSTKKSLQSYLF